MSILQHPEARIALSGTPEGARLQALSVDQLRIATTAFSSNGRSGFNDPTHMEQALDAVNRRAHGDFDEYEQLKFDETWANAESDDEAM